MSVQPMQAELLETMGHVFNPGQVPAGGAILVPVKGKPGAWKAVFASTKAAEKFRHNVDGENAPAWKGMPVVQFSASKTHSLNVLKTFLERCHYKPEWNSVPKWATP